MHYVKPTDLRFPSVMIIFIILGAVIFVCNYWTPLLSDDFRYGLTNVLSSKGRAVASQVRIDSWSSLFYTWSINWQAENFRLGNILCKLFVFLEDGRGVYYALLNSLIFLLTISGIALLIFKHLTVRSTLVSLAAFLLFCSFVRATCFWMDGSLNYLWGGCSFVWFIIFFEKTKNKPFSSIRHTLGALVLAIVATWLHEAISAPLMLALIISALCRKGERLASITYLVPIVLIFFVTTQAPGLQGRMDKLSGIDVAQIIEESLHTILRCSLIPLVITATLFVVAHKRHAHIEKLSLLPLLTLTSWCLYLYSGAKWTWLPDGPAFYANFSLMLLSLLLIRPYVEQKTTACSFIAGIIAFSYLVPLTYGTVRLYYVTESFNERIHHGTDTIRVPYKTDDEQDIWYLSSALPTREWTSKQYNSFYKMKNKHAIVDRLLLPEAELAALFAHTPNKLCTAYKNGLFIVKLPKDQEYRGANFRVPNAPITIGIHPDGRRCIRYCYFEIPDWVDSLSNHIKGQEIGKWGRSYIDGHHYALFTCPQELDNGVFEMPVLNRVTQKRSVIKVPISTKENTVCLLD